MIKYATQCFSTLALLLVGGLTAAQAQMDSNTILDANIPFQFVVGRTTLPAGKYVIRPIDESEDTPNVLEIRSANGKVGTILDTENTSLNQAPRKTEVIFDKIGNQYFLSQIFVEGENYGVQAIESKMERKLKDGGQLATKQSVASNRRRSTQAVK